MIIIFGQCNEVTNTKFTLGINYNEDCQVENLIKFLKQLHTICFGSEGGGLSFGPYTQVVAVKSMNNYSNKQPHTPHDFKEKDKIKYNVVKAVAGRFPNGTGAMMELLVAAVPPIDWTGYC